MAKRKHPLRVFYLLYRTTRFLSPSRQRGRGANETGLFGPFEAATKADVYRQAQAALERHYPPGTKFSKRVLYLAANGNEAPAFLSDLELATITAAKRTRFREEHRYPESLVGGRFELRWIQATEEVLLGSGDLTAAFSPGSGLLDRVLMNETRLAMLSERPTFYTTDPMKYAFTLTNGHVIRAFRQAKP